MANIYDPQASAYRNEPQVIYKAQVSRQPYRRGLRYGLLLVLAGIGVWYMVMLPNVAGGQNPFISPTIQRVVLAVGQIVAGVIVVIGVGRMVVFIALLVLRKPERVIFYDEGFVWEVRGKRHKYPWRAVKTVYEDPHAWFFRGKPRLQWGHITLKMRDGQTFRFTAAHNSLLQFLQRVRPYYASEQGTRMGQLLRLNKTFHVHEKLQVVPAGLIIDNKKQVKWQNLKLDMTERDLIIRQVAPNGDIQKVRSFPLKQIRNLGGFIEVTESTIETFQRPNPYAN
jgi:hypothetical protein